MEGLPLLPGYSFRDPTVGTALYYFIYLIFEFVHGETFSVITYVI
jgi:hypothetical protein